MEPLEISSGVVLGERRRSHGVPVDLSTTVSTVRGALERVLVPALESPPCFVAFSGGRDSAAILSLATRLARSRGLPDPVPVSLRFENRPRSDETEWQEVTIEHLALERWKILRISSELDPLGPVATEVLVRHGLFWPPVAHRIVPLLEAARGHVVLFGTGGDEVFSPWLPDRPRARVGVRGRPLLQGIPRAVFNQLPERLRIVLQVRLGGHLRWLRSPARRMLARGYLETVRRARSLRWSEAIRQLPDSRNFELTQSIFATLARDAGVTLVQPFFDTGFLRALGESTPPGGHTSRAAAMERHFGDVLPPKMLERTTKAVFDELHGGAEVRAFAERWDGRGLDPRLVDPERLRAEWMSPRPHYRSLTALNAAWLASQEPTLAMENRTKIVP